MKHRHVFSAPDLRAAEAAIAAARANGIGDECISLIACSEIEIESIPTSRLDATTDMVPAAIRGAMEGGAMGLLGGMIAVMIPALGITIAGVGLITVICAGVGGWSSALIGSTIPDPIRRQFEKEIERGRILVVIDGDKATLSAIEVTLAKLGAQALPFDHLSLTS